MTSPWQTVEERDGVRDGIHESTCASCYHYYETADSEYGGLCMMQVCDMFHDLRLLHGTTAEQCEAVENCMRGENSAPCHMFEEA